MVVKYYLQISGIRTSVILIPFFYSLVSLNRLSLNSFVRFCCCYLNLGISRSILILPSILNRCFVKFTCMYYGVKFPVLLLLWILFYITEFTEVLISTILILILELIPLHSSLAPFFSDWGFLPAFIFDFKTFIFIFFYLYRFGSINSLIIQSFQKTQGLVLLCFYFFGSVLWFRD